MAAATARRFSRGGRISVYFLAAVGLIAALAGCFAWIVTLPHFIIGDGKEYVCVAGSWLENGRPIASEAYFLNCAQALNPLNLSPLAGYFPYKGWWESAHFWFLSLLASPFLLLSKSLGFNGKQAFTLLHAFLSMAVALRLLHRLGLARGFAVIAVVAASPLIFWANKAHSEFFVCCALLLAFAEIAAGSLLGGAFWMAIASTQQTTLAVPAFGAVAAVLIQSRGAALRSRRSVVLLAAVACVLALQPAWYLWRISKLSYLGFSVEPGLVSAHRALSLFVDPDIGLLPAWPAGLVLLAAAAVFGRRNPLLAISALVFCAIEPLLVSMQPNWNAGGTMNVSRYAMYLLPPIVIAGTEPVGRRAALALAPLLLAYQLTWNGPAFTPARDQEYLFRTPLAEWMYSNHPGWYDPVPEVFFERQAHIDGLTASMLPPGVWSVHTENCAKILVMREPGPDAVGCVEAAEYVRLGRVKPNARGYVNRR